MMSPHQALTSKDIEVLIVAAEADGTVKVEETKSVVVTIAGQAITGANRESLKRLMACGYLEGGPDQYQITRAGGEYADSMK
jgi:hypothetical protein